MRQAAEELDKKQSDQVLQLPQLTSQRYFQQNQSQQPITFIEQSKIEKLVTNSQRFYRKSTWANSITENCIELENQSISIELHYGPLATKINVINLDVMYKSDQSSYVNSGSFGQIQKFLYRDRYIAMKLINKNENQQSFFYVQNIYKEYFLALMASQLKVGPKIINIFGYQIVFFKNFALFAMELCQFNKSQRQIHESSELLFKNQLLNSLEVLHSFHIVHRDIKPENILWSPQYQKHVFIDFGLSQIVKQKPGQKTFATYAGSYPYCSAEMQKCFLLRSSRRVDLYQNDRHGLQKCLKNFKNHIFFHSQLNIQIQGNSYTDHFLDCLIQICNIKKSCFTRKIQDLLKQLSNCKYALKSGLYISNYIIQKEIFPPQRLNQVKYWQKNVREQLIKNNLSICQGDKIFLRLFQEINPKILFPYLLSQSCTIQNQMKNLNKWINEQMWISRIYFILNPSESSSEQRQPPQIFIFLINKLYSFLQDQPTCIFLKKMRKVFLFFYKKFSELKKKQLLQSLSDIFILIGDYRQSIEIRNFIVTIIEDPLEYCLKNLLFFMLDQNVFGLNQGVSLNYLENINKKIKQQPKQPRIQQYYKLFSQIAQKFLYCAPDNIKKHFIFQGRLASLQRLQYKILENNPEYSGVIKRIGIRFRNLYMNFICADLQNRYRQYSDKKRAQLNRKIQQIKQNSQRQTIICCISLRINNFQYIYQMRRQLQRFSRATDHKLIEQYIQLYFEINHGRKKFTQTFLAQFLQSKCYQDSSIAFFVLRTRIKWINVQLLKFPICHQQIYQQLIEIKKNLQTLCLLRKQDLKYQYQDRDAKIIQTLIIELKKNVQRRLQNNNQKDQILLLMQVLSLIKFDYLNCQQQTLKSSYLIYSQLKEHKINESHMKFNTRYNFLSFMITLMRTKSIKKKQNVHQLQEIILKIFQIELYEQILVLYFQQFVKISRKINRPLNQFQMAFQLANYLVKLQKFQQHYCQTCLKFYKNLDYLLSIHSSKQVQKKLKQFDSQRGFIFQEATKNLHGCYLIFGMLSKCHRQLPILKKYLFKIAFCLSKTFYLQCRALILKSYYYFFIMQNIKNERKLLICERLQFKSKCYFQNIEYKMPYSYRKILKKLQKWPQLVVQKFVKRINKYLNKG